MIGFREEENLSIIEISNFIGIMMSGNNSIIPDSLDDETEKNIKLFFIVFADLTVNDVVKPQI